MALDTTIGGTASDSYATVAEADAYLAGMGVTDWAALANDAKEAALRQAARWIDGRYTFSGMKVSGAQARQWPRSNAYADGYWPLPSDSIPIAVKDAQCEAAIRAAQGLLTEDIAPGNVTEETVGPITVRYSEYSNNGRRGFPVVDSLLKPVLDSVRGMYQHGVVRT